MAILDFPNSPVNGQTYTSGSTTYTYNSTYNVWNITSSNGSQGYTGSVGYTGSASTVQGPIGYTGSGLMVYPTAGVAVSTGGGWNGSLAAPSGAIVGTTDTQTLTNKTLASPTFTGTVNSTETLVVRNMLEQTTVSATTATGTVNVDLFANTVVYFTTNASANWTFNFRANSTVTANTYISNGQIATVTVLVQQGATAYYPNSHSIDGSSRTVLWQGGTAPSGGNANSVDGYTYSIIKTAANTYTIIASQTRFA